MSAFSLNSNVGVTGRWAFRLDDGASDCMFQGKTTKGKTTANVYNNMHLFPKVLENTIL